MLDMLNHIQAVQDTKTKAALLDLMATTVALQALALAQINGEQIKIEHADKWIDRIATGGISLNVNDNKIGQRAGDIIRKLLKTKMPTITPPGDSVKWWPR